MTDFAPPLKKLAESGIGVAANPAGSLGLALSPDGYIPTGLVRSDSILDGTIVNADLATNAGIIGSKLAWNVFASPPASPNSGDIWIYSGAGGGIHIYWMFVYDSAEATYTWKFVGGGEVISGPQGSISTASTTYVALTSGPSVTVPRAGNYAVHYGAHISNASGLISDCFVNVNGSVTGLGAAGSELIMTITTQNNGGAVAGAQSRTGLSVNEVLTLQVKVPQGNTATFDRAWMTVTPIRVS